MSLDVVREGRCRACGRVVPGILTERLPECRDACPRCGVYPLMLDQIGPYTFDIAFMPEAEAVACWQTFTEKGDQGEIEVLLRLEFMGRNRDAVLLAGVARYWELNEARPVRPVYSLEQLRRLWAVELENLDSLRMYRELMMRTPVA